jgi:hypothetical protein
MPNMNIIGQRVSEISICRGTLAIIIIIAITAATTTTTPTMKLAEAHYCRSGNQIE